CTRGMAFVDLAYLRKTDLRHGTIRYARRKTGQVMHVRIEPGIRMIIDRYAGACADSVYVFPLLRATDPESAYRQYQSALNSYNRKLRKLSGMLPVACHLTSYTSRHSWATAARKHEVPVTIISAALGHTSERTTQIYLDSIENSVIDSANRTVLAALWRV
ncbi:MAG: tyrosine-type recombinase/integrase, partial [Bacteroidales bacterium]|nr:tyrosine-type recombinase/integrase [Bacteroidales bacterium]